jgi:predicted Zn-dependent protease
MKALPILGALVLLVACEPVPTGTTAPQKERAAAPASATSRVSARQAQSNFASVVRRVEPIAERECKARAPSLNCDFKIVVDNRPGQPPNAFQTLERSGRPVIGFTAALLADARNTDELAFVMGHETAHHIKMHLKRQRESATGGAILGGILAAGLGVSTDLGTRIGGSIGARAYSKNNELEADALGTVIAKKAGYDPVRGAQFFARIPDPGDRFLGTHPPNASRIETVRRVNAGL